MKTDYPVPQVRIKTSAPPGPMRVMSEQDLADERAARLAANLERSDEPANLVEPIHVAVPAAPMPNTGDALLEAAKAVPAARAELARIDSRVSELRGKAAEFDELSAKLDGARARRNDLLTSAMLRSQKANTASIDKEIADATKAVQQRADDATATLGALETLDGQRTDAQAKLEQREAAFMRCRQAHLQMLEDARRLAANIHSRILDARARLEGEPAAIVERLEALIVLNPPPLADLVAHVTAAAEADLAEADKLAAIPAPPVVEVAQGPQQYLWSDGDLHLEPEPAREHMNVIAPRGHGRNEYVPGLVRVY